MYYYFQQLHNFCGRLELLQMHLDLILSIMQWKVVHQSNLQIVTMYFHLQNCFHYNLSVSHNHPQRLIHFCIYVFFSNLPLTINYLHDLIDNDK